MPLQPPLQENGFWFFNLTFSPLIARRFIILINSFTRPGVRNYRLRISQICKIRKGVNQGVVYKSSRWCFSYAQWLFATLNGGVLLSGRPEKGKNHIAVERGGALRRSGIWNTIFSKTRVIDLRFVAELNTSVTFLQTLCCTIYTYQFSPFVTLLLSLFIQ